MQFWVIQSSVSGSYNQCRRNISGPRKSKGLEAVQSPGLDASDIAASELYWIRTCQETLVQSDKFKEWKSQFGLFLDNAGLWSCKGRLENANLPASTIHPILLHNQHHFVSLQVLDCPRRIMHGGVKETLTELRMTFWIVKGRSVMKKLLRQCTICAQFNRRAYSVPESPPMPEFRVQECVPFSYVGLNYAGPLYVKIKEVGVKVWIALFTCGVSRALHLELVLDMTTEAFLRCFKCFATRRGTPLKIISDNSKTFKSANRELLQIQSDPVFKNFLPSYTFNGVSMWRRPHGGVVFLSDLSGR